MNINIQKRKRKKGKKEKDRTDLGLSRADFKAAHALVNTTCNIASVDLPYRNPRGAT